ncbi:hypothetical protein [Persicobacter diffluens]|uniref:DUF4397 domain-containing protein n=1 Tax=Persicobacter diffluens TaxID=981 RepID=A0AAN4VUU4_9BACT|nr:hypothetical protein PEDI_09180 [Persicobacter diffluens]
MKNLTFYLCLFVAFIFTLSSCSDDDGDLPISETLEINIPNQDPEEGVAVIAGQQITVALQLRSTDNNLETFSINGPGIDITYEDILDTDDDENLEGIRPGDTYDQVNKQSVNYTMNYTVSTQDIETAIANDGTLTYLYTLTDKDGEITAEAKFTVPQYAFTDEQSITLIYKSINQTDGENQSEEAGIEYSGNDVAANIGEMMVFSATDMVEVSQEVYDAVTAADTDSFSAANTAYEDGSKISDIAIGADADFEAKYVVVKKEEGQFSVVHFEDLEFAPGDNRASINFKLIGLATN